MTKKVDYENFTLVCVILFLIPWACVGIGSAFQTYKHFATWAYVQTWPAVPATIDKLELEERGANGSTIYRLSGEFSYTVDNVRHVSERIAIWNDTTNLGMWHRKQYRRLKPLKNKPNSAVSYVDWMNPRNAVLVKDVRWERFVVQLIVALLFGTIGMIGLPGSISLWRQYRVEVKNKQRFPAKPWKWQPYWNGNQVRSCQSSVLLWSQAALIWFLVATTPITILALVELLQGNLFAILGFLPMCLTLPVGYYALRQHRFHARMGKAVLELPAVPIRPGDSITAACIFPTQHKPIGKVEVEIKRQDSHSDGGGTKLSVGWKHLTQLEDEDCEIVDGKLCIAVPIDIPIGIGGGSDSSAWDLRLRVPTGIGRLGVYFILPVFDTVDPKPVGSV